MIYKDETAITISDFLLQIKAIKLDNTNPFTWASGMRSPIYCDKHMDDPLFIQALECTFAYRPFSNHYVKDLIEAGVTCINETVPDIKHSPVETIKTIYTFRRSIEPYDAIIVTAGAPRVAVDLLAQLAIGGRLVIPIGSRFVQELYKITKRRRKSIRENLGGCRFVPLIGKDAWEEE